MSFATASRDSLFLTEEEAESLRTLRKLWDLALSSSDLDSYLRLRNSQPDTFEADTSPVPQQISSRDIQLFVETFITEIVPTVEPGVRLLLFRFAAQLGSKWTRRLSRDIERSLTGPL